MRYRVVIVLGLLLPLLASAQARAFEISTQGAPAQTAALPQPTTVPAARPRPALVVSHDEDYAAAPSFRLTKQTALSLAAAPPAANDRPALTHSYAERAAVSAAPIAVPALALTTPANSYRNGAPSALGATVTHQATNQLKLQGGYNWNAPSKYDASGSQYNTNFGANTFDPHAYEGSYSLAAGAEFQQTKALSFRGGVQYDSNSPQQAALQNSQPSPRALAAVGASYLLGDSALVDVAASHVFFADGMMGVAQKLSSDSNGDTQVALKGKAFSHDNVIKIQFRWKFK